MEIENIISQFMEWAEEDGCLPILHAFGHGIKVNLPMNEAIYTMSIDKLPIDSRYQGKLYRYGLKTVGDIAALYEDGKDIRIVTGIGKKGAAILHSMLLDFFYSEMTDSQKKRFWRNVLEQNIDQTSASA